MKSFSPSCYLKFNVNFSRSLIFEMHIRCEMIDRYQKNQRPVKDADLICHYESKVRWS